MARIKIFDFNIIVGSYNAIVDEFILKAKLRDSSYAIFMNSHMIYEYYHLEGFKKVVDNADYVCPDGMPLYYSTVICKEEKSERIAGNDIIFSMIEKANRDSLRVYFYGSSEYILNKIMKRLSDEYPNLKAKAFSPPFRALTDTEMDLHCDMINDFGTNVVFVGLGCPKQELWMDRAKGKIGALMLGVGGAFSLYGGVDKRAPKWMREMSLEWLYRFVLEPRRLFKRYFITNSYFIYLFIREFIIKKVFK